LKIYVFNRQIQLQPAKTIAKKKKKFKRARRDMTRVNDRIRAPKIRVVYGEDSSV
jgi:hypothetical protein